MPLPLLSRLILPVAGLAIAYLTWQLAQILYEEFTHPLRRLPSPRNPSILFGNFKELRDNPYLTRQWRSELGPIFLFKNPFNTRDLYVGDTVAIDHICKHSTIYRKRLLAGKINSRLTGQGLLSVEGDDHKRQRRVMNPAFGTAQIKSLTRIFVDKSNELRDVWLRLLSPESSPQRINVLSWLSRMTLDAIGAAGFGLDFHSLDTDRPPNEIHTTFAKFMDSPSATLLEVLRDAQNDLPLLRGLYVPVRKTMEDARKVLFKIGAKFLQEWKIDGNSGSHGRDLLSLLLRANLDPDLDENHRMSDVEVIGQIQTFLVAGHATSSAAIAWALHCLSVNQDAQRKLREELLSLPTDNPTLEQLDSLVYLDSVIKETLRRHAPVGYIRRIATQDDVLPLAKPCVDANGKVLVSLPIRKGQAVRVPIGDVNTDPAIWGDDAHEFRPERWAALPESAHSIPGVWPNLLTFLAGPRNCIGFRFSIAEQKALLFVLIRAFEFMPAVDDAEFRTSSRALQLPFIKSEMEGGTQMPLMLRPYAP